MIQKVHGKKDVVNPAGTQAAIFLEALQDLSYKEYPNYAAEAKTYMLQTNGSVPTRLRQSIALYFFLANMGNITATCQMIGLPRQTFYKRKKKNKKFAEGVEQATEICIDFAEQQLFNQMRNGVAASTIFFLKTKAKHRGYAEDGMFAGANVNLQFYGGTSQFIQT